LFWDWEFQFLPRHLTLTMMPWLSRIESTYRPDPLQVAHRIAPLT
jgi:hypothetical protein